MNPDTAESMPLSRVQHLVPAAAVLALALIVAWVSFTREPSEAFLFPRMIASVMLLLALWNFIRASLGLARVGDGLTRKGVGAITPGLCVIVLLVYVAARYLGFYSASWLAFLSIYSLYDPASHTLFAVWVKRVLITTAFLSVIYALFSLLLQVQTPRGLFI